MEWSRYSRFCMGMVWIVIDYDGVRYGEERLGVTIISFRGVFPLS